MKNHVKGTGGNCEPGDPTALLEIMTDTTTVDGNELDISTVAMIRRYDMLIREPVNNDHDYSDIPTISSLTEFQEAVLPYVAGSAGKLTAKTCHCPTCCEALGSKRHQSTSTFITLKDMGGLFKPSKSVIDICKLAELKLRQVLKVSNGKLPHRE